ncbi:MAG: hypothetical protein ACREJN_07870, partial [Nitrospiraceae bacterium]
AQRFPVAVERYIHQWSKGIRMSTERIEVYKQLRVAQDKHVYFLLTAAGAAIALAVNQTQSVALSWSQLPLGGSVLCWGLSFFFGCRHLNYVASTLYANAELFRVNGGEYPEVGRHPEIMEAVSSGIRKAIEDNSNRANRLGQLQFRFLIAGAVFYVGWHVWEMWLRTIQPAGA